MTPAISSCWVCCVTIRDLACPRWLGEFGMSAPAVRERVLRLEESGVIRGYRLDLDAAALGYPITAYVRVRPTPGQLPKSR